MHTLMKYAEDAYAEQAVFLSNLYYVRTYHCRVKAEKFSRSSVMDKIHQFTVKDLDNNIQFLCLMKTIQQPQNVSQTLLKICD